MSLSIKPRGGRVAVLVLAAIAAAGVNASAAARTVSLAHRESGSSTYAKVREIWVGGDISGGHSAALAPDGRQLYVSGNNSGRRGGNDVRVYNTATRKFGRRYGFKNDYIDSLALSTDATTLYVATNDGTVHSYLNALRVPTGTLQHRITLGSGYPTIEIAPQGKVLYVAEGSTLRILTTATLKVRETLRFPRTITDIATAPDGTRIYVGVAGAKATSAQIEVVPTATDRVIRKIPVAALGGMTVSSDSRHVYAMSSQHGRGTLNVVSASRLRVTRRISAGPSPVAFTIAPNERYAYVGTYVYPTRVSVINLATSKLVKKIDTHYIPYGMTFAPSGRTLYVATGLGGG